jgi:hypothetical protein
MVDWLQISLVETSPGLKFSSRLRTIFQALVVDGLYFLMVM